MLRHGAHPLGFPGAPFSGGARLHPPRPIRSRCDNASIEVDQTQVVRRKVGGFPPPKLRRRSWRFAWKRRLGSALAARSPAGHASRKYPLQVSDFVNCACPSHFWHSPSLLCTRDKWTKQSKILVRAVCGSGALLRSPRIQPDGAVRRIDHRPSLSGYGRRGGASIRRNPSGLERAS